MPRDPNGAYKKPNLDVVKGADIESAKYNGTIDDIAADLNTLTPAIRPYPDRAAAVASIIHPSVGRIFVLSPDNTKVEYVRDPSGTALTTNDGAVGWSPADIVTPDHWAENTTPGTTSMSAAINSAIDYQAAAGGGTVHLFPGETYACSGTIVLKTDVYIESMGDPAIIQLADGANTRLLETEGFDAQKAGTDTDVTYGIGMRNIIFDGNSANNATGEGVFLAESGGYFENIHISDFAGTGFERQGVRSVDFADDDSGNFPISPFFRRVETIISDLFVAFCGSASAPCVLIEGPGDLHGGSWFIGGNDGQLVLNSDSADLEYLHAYANGGAVADDYGTKIQTQMSISSAEIRDHDYGGLLIEGDEVSIGTLYASRNGRKVTAAGIYHIKIDANRCSIGKGKIFAKDQAGVAFDGDGVLPLLAVDGNQNHIDCQMTGNLDAVRTATEGLRFIGGSQNIIKATIFGIDGPAVIYDAGTHNDISYSVFDSDTAIEKNAFNTGGRFRIRANSGSVDTKISGTIPRPGTVEDFVFSWSGVDLCSCRLLSDDVAADAVATGQLTLAHGMIDDGTYSDFQCSVTRGTGNFPADAEIDVSIASRDATNVYVRWNVRTASATSGAKFKVAVHGQLGT